VIAEGTVDEEVLRVLQGKGRTQEEFLEAIKARIREEVATWDCLEPRL